MLSTKLAECHIGVKAQFVLYFRVSKRKAGSDPSTIGARMCLLGPYMICISLNVKEKKKII